VNKSIVAPKVLLIGPEGEKFGIVDREEAIKKAQNFGFDLVEVAPNTNPPVCRIMDYGRFLYEEKKKERKAKKRQQSQGMKEVMFRPKIGKNDYEIKIRRIMQFLHSHRVKVEIRMRGREKIHPELAQNLLKRIIDDTKEFAMLNGEIKTTDHSLTFQLLPKKGG